jgi:hypothetical protein
MEVMDHTFVDEKEVEEGDEKITANNVTIVEKVPPEIQVSARK